MKNNFLTRFVFILLGSLCLLSATFGALEDDVYFYSTLTTNANDEVNSNDLTNSGVTFSSEGAYFGGNDYFTFPSQFANVFTNSFTISTNIKYSSFESDSLTGCQLYFKEDSSHTHQCIENRNGNGFGYYTYSADGRGGTDKNGEPSSNTWYNETLVYDESTYTMTFYVNGVQKWTSTGSSGIGSVNTMRFGAMAWSGLDNYLTGYVKNMAIFDRALSSTEVTELQNNGLFGADTPTIQTNLSEFYNIQNISIQLNTTTNTNMSYSLDNGTLTSICNNCNNSILNLNSLSEGSHSILFVSEDENGQVNTTTNFNIDLTNPTINNSITNYTSYTINGFNSSCNDLNLDYCNITLNNQSVALNTSSFTFTKNGNINYTIIAADLAGNTINESGVIFVNPYAYFYVQDNVTSTKISDYTLNSYISNGTLVKIPIYDLGLGNHSLNFSKHGYENILFSTTFSDNSNINTTFSVAPVTLAIQMFNSESPTTQLTYSVTILNNSESGQVFTSQTNFNKKYSEVPVGDIELIIEATGYQTAHFYNTLTPYTSLNIKGYLMPTSSTSAVEFTVKDFTDGVNLDDVIIEAQQLINGSYVTTTQAKTTSGQAFLYYDISKEYRLVFTKDGYVMATVNTAPNKLEYNVLLKKENSNYNFFDGVSRKFKPQTNTIEGGFNYSFESFLSGKSISSASWELYTDTGLTLVNQTNTNPTGTTFTDIVEIPKNASFTKIYSKLTYLVDGKEQTFTKTYNVFAFADGSFIKNSQEFKEQEDEDAPVIRWLFMMFLIGAALVAGDRLSVERNSLSLVPIPFMAFFWVISWLPFTYFAVGTIAALILWYGGKQ